MAPALRASSEVGGSALDGASAGTTRSARTAAATAALATRSSLAVLAAHGERLVDLGNFVLGVIEDAGKRCLMGFSLGVGLGLDVFAGGPGFDELTDGFPL